MPSCMQTLIALAVVYLVFLVPVLMPVSERPAKSGKRPAVPAVWEG